MKYFMLLCGAAGDSAGSIEDGILLFGKIVRKLARWFDAEKEHLAICSALAALGIIAALALWFVFSQLLSRVARKVSPTAETTMRELALPAALVALLTGLSLANKTVDFPGSLDLMLDKIFYAGFILCFVWGALRVIGAIDGHFAARRLARADSGMDRLVSDLVRRSVKTVVWFVAVIFVAQNLFGFNVTALLTGAGVAGLAIAFAAQNTIANIFGAVSIVTDRIFKVGDFVDVGGKRGTVEAVGFRSTKLRSLDGTLWNLPNRLVADAAIENISLRKNIKFAFTLNLVYSTTPEQMRLALEILGDILNSYPGFDHEKTPPRFSFTGFNASSLDLGVTVWFDTRDFKESQRMKQEINLAILERFNAAGLSFAYPSVTNYIVEQK